MMFITPDLSISYKEENSLKALLEDIDRAVLKAGKDIWTEVTFGMESPCSLTKVEDLRIYKEIIQWKLSGCNCYKHIKLSSIISKIKQLTA